MKSTHREVQRRAAVGGRDADVGAVLQQELRDLRGQKVAAD